jgi:hypothetical protein
VKSAIAGLLSRQLLLAATWMGRGSVTRSDEWAGTAGRSATRAIVKPVIGLGMDSSALSGGS